jgi:cytochrome P450
VTTVVPASGIDLYTPDNLTDPYPAYRELRKTGPVVWLDKYEVWAVSTYREVTEALHDHETFSSASGVGLTEQLNRIMAGNVIASDPPEHDQLRAVLGQEMNPRSLRTLEPDLQRRATELVAQLVQRRRFDAVTDLAQVYPMAIVPDLLGWPADGREHFLAWASAGFNALGPENDRTLGALPVMRQMVEYLAKMAQPGMLREGSWGANLVAAAAAGKVQRELLPTLLGNFLAPSLDTTVSALGSAIWLLGTHVDQWRAIRADVSLIDKAFSEVMRYRPPVRGFSRLVIKDRELGGVRLQAGSRVLLLYASANRDDTFWDDPDTFDIQRSNAVHQLGFGHGVHSCLGQGLARLEVSSVLAALAAQVSELEVGEPSWRVHNTIQGLASLPCAVMPATAGQGASER